MRIAIVANGRSPHTVRWVNALAARGHDLTVVWELSDVSEASLAQYGGGVEHVARAQMGAATGRGARLIEAVPAKRLATRVKPELVQGMYLVRHGWTAAQIGRPLVQFALGSDVIAFERVGAANPRKQIARAYVNRRTTAAVERSDMVFCDSSAIAATLRAAVPGIRTELVRIGVELSPNADSARAWRSELAIADDAFVILSTRLFTPNYNIETIIRAFAKVLADIPDAYLILKHYPTFGDDSYRRLCHELVGELGLTDRIRLIGALPRADLLALHRIADAYVSVPSRDATAVSVLEAMAASVPVIASRTHGMDGYVLRDGITSLLVSAGDELELADAIVRLHDSSELRASLAGEGYEVVKEVGNLNREIERAERFYTELVDKAHAGSA